MNPTTVNRTDRELHLQRELDAPISLVWDALTQPERLARWWGPSGFTITTASHDLRPSGSWRFTMHGPDGRDYPNHIRFLTVDPPTTLAYTHVGDEGSEPVHFETVISLEKLSEKRTRVDFRMTFATADELDRVIRDYNALEGGKQTIANLAAHVESPDEDRDDVLVIRRVLKAPRELVWDVWTDADHLLRWFHPKSWELSTCDLDPREGGQFHYCMSAEGMPDMWGLWNITRLQRPDLIEFVVSFSDEHRNIVRAPFGEHWPLEVFSRVTLEPHAGVGAGTLMTLYSEPINATPEERAAFAAGVPSMNQGWGHTLENLEEYLDAADGRLSVTRAFDAPLDLVWRAWTDPAMIRQWFAPKECEILSAEGDCRVGGRYTESMKGGDTVYTVSGVYREIVERKLLVFTHQWDEPDAPETLVRVEFSDLGDGRTEVRLTQTGLASVGSVHGHTEGWTSALENLADRLPTLAIA